MEFLVRGVEEFGEPGVFMAFEENAGELTKNFASLGYDLKAMVAQKKLVLEFVHIERSEVEETGEYDLEGLFIRLGHAIDSIGAKRVVLDTVEALFSGFSNTAILRAELRRLFRWLKAKGVTAIITAERGETSLTRYGLEEYVADCVIVLDHRVDGQMATRRLRIVKYRGSSHGTSEYPFLIDEGGISILPITSTGLEHEAGTERVSRLIDFFKMQRITALITSLTGGSSFIETTEVGVSSLMDAWLMLRDVENGAERNRVLYLVKSRGMAHSNQVREFLLTDRGVEVRDVYVGPSGLLLAGGARETLEAQEKARVLMRGQETESKMRELDRKRQAMEAKITMLRAEFDVEQTEATKTIAQAQTRAGVLAGDRVQMARQRQGDATGNTRKTPKHK